ncbi:MAG: HD domain-containing protein [Candidatus Thermoplasmatota archaeon]
MKIEEIFPEVMEIKNKEIREKTMKIWNNVLEKTGLEDKLDKVPFTILLPTKTNLVEHTRRVTRMAIEVGKARGDVNIDYIIAGALLHDVGKLLEYKFKQGKLCKSELGKLIRHPTYGLSLALEEKLPVEIAHIVGAHSDDMKVERIPEATIIHHCDFIDFEIEKWRVGK